MKKIKIGDFIVHALSAIVCISFAVIGAVIDMPTWINVFGGFCGGFCGILAATTIIHAYTHRNPSNVGAKMADKIITFAQESPELNTNAERAAFLLAMVDIFNNAAKKYTAPPTDIMDFLKKCGGLRWTGERRPEVDLYPAQMKIRFEREVVTDEISIIKHKAEILQPDYKRSKNR